MDLKLHQRQKFNKYLLPKLKNQSCEICGKTTNLKLYHKKSFVKVLIEALDELNLLHDKYKYIELDTKQYTKEELKLITNYMLGKQIKYIYKTVCIKCHNKIYNNHNDKKQKEKEYIISILPTIKELTNTILYKKDREKLIKLLNIKNPRYRLKRSISVMNNYVQEHFNKKIISKRIYENGKHITVWILQDNN